MLWTLGRFLEAMGALFRDVAESTSEAYTKTVRFVLD